MECPNPSLPQIRPHRLKIALLHPQIAPNTGNIARACVATGTELHLIRPMGFVLSDRNLRRSAMDYWPRLKLTVHDDSAKFFNVVHGSASPIWLFSTHGRQSLWDIPLTEMDWLIFGSETDGIPETILATYPDRVARIPQKPDERCLNLSTAVAAALFEALRRTQCGTMHTPTELSRGES
jgi:tRNA (cytidine/uridine-2'-O-)-methyltransferase